MQWSSSMQYLCGALSSNMECYWELIPAVAIPTSLLPQNMNELRNWWWWWWQLSFMTGSLVGPSGLDFWTFGAQNIKFPNFPYNSNNILNNRVLRENAWIAISQKRHFRSPKLDSENTFTYKKMFYSGDPKFSKIVYKHNSIWKKIMESFINLILLIY